MRKLIFYLLLIISPAAFAQYKLEFGGGAGAANYLGEIGGLEKTRRDFIADLKFSQTRQNAEIFCRYRLHPDFSLKSSLAYLRIQGHDNLSTNPGRRGRNLHFRNDIFELAVTVQYFFYEMNDVGGSYRYRNDFRMYIGAGVGGFYHNPKAQYLNKWVALQPLSTEGQGIIPGTKKYSKFQVGIPMAFGMYYTYSKKHRFGFEINHRLTFTDYLDDISTVYADPNILPNQMSIDLANQTLQAYNQEPTLPHPNNYAPGSKRGDPTHNDTYFTVNFTYGYVIKGKSKYGKKRYKTYFKRKKYKKRKIRAKF